MLCWYCGKLESDEKKSVGISMFGEVLKTRNDNGVESVSYSTKDVMVPRCASCKAKHSKAKLFIILSGVFAVIAVVLGLLEFINIEIIASGFIRGFILGLAATLAVGLFVLRISTLKGIKSFKKTKSYDEINDLLAKGYEFGKAPKQDYGKKLTVETKEETEEE